MTEGFRGKLKWNHETQSFESVPESRAQINAPAIITDEIEPVESMATQDRQIFTSRSKYYRHLEEHGYHVKEKGEEAKGPKKYQFDHKQFRDDFERASEDLKNDRVPMTEQEKERCRQEMRMLEQYKRRQRGR